MIKHPSPPILHIYMYVHGSCIFQENKSLQHQNCAYLSFVQDMKRDLAGVQNNCPSYIQSRTHFLYIVIIKSSEGFLSGSLNKTKAMPAQIKNEK
jgi:hypothetical protein